MSLARLIFGHYPVIKWYLSFALFVRSACNRVVKELRKKSFWLHLVELSDLCAKEAVKTWRPSFKRKLGGRHTFWWGTVDNQTRAAGKGHHSLNLPLPEKALCVCEMVPWAKVSSVNMQNVSSAVQRYLGTQVRWRRWWNEDEARSLKMHSSGH